MELFCSNAVCVSYQARSCLVCLKYWLTDYVNDTEDKNEHKKSIKNAN